ncbi:MAG: hypothetical protein AB7S80_19590 [Rhizobiaceae bacterium]
MEAIVTAFVWYLVVSAPQGGLVVMPSGFDTREQCEEALAEFNKKPAQGWSLQCVPGGTAYDDGIGEPEAVEPPADAPAQ